MLNVIQFVCVILDSYYKWNIFGQFFISNLFNVFPHFNVTLFLHILTHLDFTNCTFVVVPLDKFSQCIYFLLKKERKKKRQFSKKYRIVSKTRSRHMRFFQYANSPCTQGCTLTFMKLKREFFSDFFAVYLRSCCKKGRIV